MGPLRLGVIAVILCATLAGGCARPAVPPPVKEEAPTAQPLVVLAPAVPLPALPLPPDAPEPPKLRHSQFFSKLSPKSLDDRALRCVPKDDPKWKWLSVFSGMSASSHPKPGEFYHVEAGRYFRSTPAGIAQFLEALEIEFEEMLSRGGVNITCRATFADLEPPEDVFSEGFSVSEGFAFVFASDSAQGTARATVILHKDGYYMLVVRVEEAVVEKGP